MPLKVRPKTFRGHFLEMPSLFKLSPLFTYCVSFLKPLYNYRYAILHPRDPNVSILEVLILGLFRGSPEISFPFIKLKKFNIQLFNHL